jgi:hypothetical protein
VGVARLIFSMVKERHSAPFSFCFSHLLFVIILFRFLTWILFIQKEKKTYMFFVCIRMIEGSRFIFFDPDEDFLKDNIVLFFFFTITYTKKSDLLSDIGNRDFLPSLFI